MADKKASIVIKKVKKGGHGGHHGGAWKVAYADFVTAMMAFFLLLWLLTATPVENLKGLADYFSPTMGLKDKMGIGFRGGQGTQPEGASPGDSANVGLIFGAPPSGPIIKLTDKDNEAEENKESSLFSRMEQDISKAVQENPEMKDSETVLIQQTPEGLMIQLVDKKDHPMFEPGKSDLQPMAKKILERVVNIIRYLPNYIQVSGHTVEAPPPNASDTFSNWELSAERANAARRLIIEKGIDPDQIARVVGKADQEPLDKDNPNQPSNARISITLLRNQKAPSHKRVAPEQMLLDGNSVKRFRSGDEGKAKATQPNSETKPVAPKAHGE